jgi:hypothetical protein
MMQSNEKDLAGQREIFARLATDPRSDDGRRLVVIARQCIAIERILHGAKLHVAVPIEAFSGIALTGEPADDGGRFYRLRLMHRDPDLCIDLEAGPDQGQVAAAWRNWSAFFESAAFSGSASSSARSLRPASSASKPRRRSATLVKRRPRRLFRRKSGVIAGTAKVFRAEHEIICYE